MNICLLTRHFGPTGAGIGRVSWEIWQGLHNGKHRVTGIQTSGASLASYLFYSFVSIRSQIPDDCDVYHALTPVESLWIPKSKAVVTFHDLFPIMHQDKQGAGIGGSKVKQAIASRYFGYCAKVATRCRIIACNSEQTRQDIVRYLEVPIERVHVVKLGIPNSLEPKPKPDNTFRIGYLGQLDRRKRVHLLINAFVASNINAELVVGGNGSERRALEILAGNDPRVKFLGFVPEEQLAGFYVSLDLFVSPTAVEGWGLPLVEAMACKCPVAILEDAILPWEIKARCANVDSIEGLLNRLQRGHRRLDVVLKHYKGFGWEVEDNCVWTRQQTWDKTVSEYVKLYEEVLSAKQ